MDVVPPGLCFQVGRPLLSKRLLVATSRSVAIATRASLRVQTDYLRSPPLHRVAVTGRIGSKSKVNQSPQIDSSGHCRQGPEYEAKVPGLRT